MVDICDAHVHVSASRPLAYSMQMLRGLMARFGYGRIALMALPHSGRRGHDSPANNLAALACKAALDGEEGRRIHACAGLRHTDRASPDDLLAQAKRAIDLGFDGFKMLEGKPTMRRRFGHPLDGPLYEPFFAWAEESGWPVTMHSGDPESFWKHGGAPDAAQDGPWSYDETFPALSQIRSETEGILKRHPRLRLTLAHFFFLGDSPEEAARLLDAYPGLCLDLTPGAEMFAGFTRRRDEWRGFFMERRDRLLFGSDSDNWHSSEDLATYDWNFGFPINLVLDMLGGGEPFRFHDADLGLLVPLDLPEDVRRAILHDNFVRRFGDEPRRVNAALAEEDARALAAGLASGDERDLVEPGRLQAEMALARELAGFFRDRISG